MLLRASASFKACIPLPCLVTCFWDMMGEEIEARRLPFGIFMAWKSSFASGMVDGEGDLECKFKPKDLISMG